MADEPTATTGSTAVNPPSPPAPPAPASAPVERATTASSSNVQPGVDLQTGVRTDDDADAAKRDKAVSVLADQYDDPKQRARVFDRFDMTEDSAT